MAIRIDPDMVIICDDNDEEIVAWTENEWIEDPTVTIAIANAIHMFYTEGPEYLRACLAE